MENYLKQNNIQPDHLENSQNDCVRAIAENEA